MPDTPQDLHACSVLSDGQSATALRGLHISCPFTQISMLAAGRRAMDTVLKNSPCDRLVRRRAR